MKQNQTETKGQEISGKIIIHKSKNNKNKNQYKTSLPSNLKQKENSKREMKRNQSLLRNSRN